MNKIMFKKMTKEKTNVYYLGEINGRGLPHGYGAYSTSLNTYAIGKFSNDWFQGPGVIFENNFLKLGTFYNFLLSGKGLIDYQNDEFRFGDFQFGNTTGFGFHIYKNGDFLFCNDLKGCMNGPALLYRKSELSLYYAEIKEGEISKVKKLNDSLEKYNFNINVKSFINPINFEYKYHEVNDYLDFVGGKGYIPNNGIAYYEMNKSQEFTCVKNGKRNGISLIKNNNESINFINYDNNICDGIALNVFYKNAKLYSYTNGKLNNSYILFDSNNVITIVDENNIAIKLNKGLNIEVFNYNNKNKNFLIDTFKYNVN